MKKAEQELKDLLEAREALQELREKVKNCFLNNQEVDALWGSEVLLASHREGRRMIASKVQEAIRKRLLT